MSDTEQQQQEDTAAQDKQVKLFEKMFRLMDSSTDAEAEAAFRKARNLLPNIGLTFGDLLEMIDNATASADAEDLRELVAQYQQANDQLKMAEDVLLQENERLNLLLRNFRDAKVMSTKLSILSVRESVGSTARHFINAVETLGKLDLPATPEDLEARYRLQVAEALNLPGGINGQGVYERWLFWNLRKLCGRDMSDESVVKLQDLVSTMDSTLKDQAALLNEIEGLKVKGQDLGEKLDLLLAEAAPKPLYDKAMEQLRDLQIAFGEGKDIATQKKINAALEHENTSLTHENSRLLGENQRLLAEIAELQDAAETAEYRASLRSGGGKGGFSGWPFGSGNGGGNAHAYSEEDEEDLVAKFKPTNARIAELEHEIAYLGEQAAEKDRFIAQMASDKMVTETDALLSAGDARFVASLEQMPLVLTETERKLQTLADGMRAQFAAASSPPPLTGWQKFKKMLGIAPKFNTAASREQRELQKTLAALDATLGRLDQSKVLAEKLSKDIDAKASSSMQGINAELQRFKNI